MNKQIKKLRKLMISHQLESLVVLFTVIGLIVCIILKQYKMMPLIVIVDILVLFGPKLLSIGKNYYDKLDLKFIKKTKKSNNKKTKEISKKKKEIENLEKKEDVNMVKKKKNTKPKKSNKSGIKKVLKVCTMCFLVFMILGFIGATLFFGYVVTNAPKFDPENLYTSESSILYDINGKEFAKIGSQAREKINYDEMSDVLVDAIIATEDSRFFQHNGFDFPRFIKASLGQVLGNSNAGGASTLTMQIAKNAYTSTKDEGLEGIIRKFTDIYLAIFKIEKKYSKQQIFEFYANSYYMGGGAHGVEQASLNYFGKHASEINLSEAALLAGLFQSPGAYDPFIDPERAMNRRNLVLKLMVRHGYITQKEADAASEIKIDDMLVEKGVKSNNPYQGFIDTVVREVKEDLGKNPYMVSMKIYTTMDPRVQDIVNNIMSGATFGWENPIVDAGVTILDPQTGALRGVGTGRDTSKEGLYNNAVQINRQIGSTSKPLFDYAPSIEYNNTSTYTLLGDEEYTYSDGHSISNYDAAYHGIVTSRYAVVDSRNIPALKTFQKVANKNTIEMVTKLGLHPELDATKSFLHEAHAIGGYNGESPLSVGAAYNAFANGGNYYEPHSYSKIVFRDTDQKYEQKIEKTRAMSEETAFMVYNMLESATQGALGNFSNNIIRKRYAAKTGTSNYTQEIKDKYGLAGDAINDLWLVGLTDEYSISIWYGYDKLDSTYYSHFGNIQNMYLFSALAKDIFTRDTKVVQPAGVVNVTVEMNTIEPMLPSAYTPDYLKVTELFKKGTEPTAVSPRFNQLENPSNLKGNSNNGKVALTWNTIKTPDLANSDYLHKYYGQLFRGAGWISSAVGAHLGVTGPLGYDVYEKLSDGNLKHIGSTSSASFSFDGTSNGEHSYVVKSAYSSFKSNASSGITTTVRVSGVDEDALICASINITDGAKIPVTTGRDITSRVSSNVPGIKVELQSISDISEGIKKVKVNVTSRGTTCIKEITVEFIE
ncbi:MAG: transglycosylase domain-containing protein [Bacilli bacterium]